MTEAWSPQCPGIQRVCRLTSAEVVALCWRRLRLLEVFRLLLGRHGQALHSRAPFDERGPTITSLDLLDLEKHVVHVVVHAQVHQRPNRLTHHKDVEHVHHP